LLAARFGDLLFFAFELGFVQVAAAVVFEGGGSLFSAFRNGVWLSTAVLLQGCGGVFVLFF
jgi:hypothetical protein